MHVRHINLAPITFDDGLQKDGLVDAYANQAMGIFADTCASEHKFTREAQDAFAIQSYKRSTDAWNEGNLILK